MHVYGFTREDDKAGDISRQCVESLGGQEPLGMAVSFVLNVATHKDMMLATFRLTGGSSCLTRVPLRKGG